MSMAWAPMCGQTLPAAAASFLGAWVVMMAAMMLPSLLPRLGRYRQAVRIAGVTWVGRLTALIGFGYFCVWAAIGMAVFPVGMALAAVEMQEPELARAVPIAAGLVVLVAGGLQFTAWKTRQLARWREALSGCSSPMETGAACRYGLRLGLHCNFCCANATAVLLVLGMMDLRVMAAVTAAITIERLAPAGARAARAIGVVAVGMGLLLIAQAVGLA